MTKNEWVAAKLLAVNIQRITIGVLEFKHVCAKPWTPEWVQAGADLAVAHAKLGRTMCEAYVLEGERS